MAQKTPTAEDYAELLKQHQALIQVLIKMKEENENKLKLINKHLQPEWAICSFCEARLAGQEDLTCQCFETRVCSYCENGSNFDNINEENPVIFKGITVRFDGEAHYPLTMTCPDC